VLPYVAYGDIEEPISKCHGVTTNSVTCRDMSRVVTAYVAKKLNKDVTSDMRHCQLSKFIIN